MPLNTNHEYQHELVEMIKSRQSLAFMKEKLFEIYGNKFDRTFVKITDDIVLTIFELALEDEYELKNKPVKLMNLQNDYKHELVSLLQHKLSLAFIESKLFQNFGNTADRTFTKICHDVVDQIYELGLKDFYNFIARPVVYQMSSWREMIGATDAHPTPKILDNQMFTICDEVTKIEIAIGPIADEKVVDELTLCVPKGTRISYRTSNKD